MKVLRLNHIKYQQKISLHVLLGLIYREQSKDARHVKKTHTIRSSLKSLWKSSFPILAQRMSWQSTSQNRQSSMQKKMESELYWPMAANSRGPREIYRIWRVTKKKQTRRPSSMHLTQQLMEQRRQGSTLPTPMCSTLHWDAIRNFVKTRSLWLERVTPTVQSSSSRWSLLLAL